MSPVNFGFIGAGQISHHSADIINKHPHARVIAVQDPHTDRVKELCAAHGIPKACTTADEIFSDPEVDAVYIATPNKFHVPLTVQALEAGKHVILEKPFAMSYPEALLATETAKRAGKVLTLGMNMRFGKAPQTLRALVQAGMLGEIYHAKGFWFRRTGIPRLGTWFGNRELAGGGCLYDIGVHLLDLSLYLMDNFDAVSVYGATYTKFGHRGLGEGGWGKSDRADIPFDVEDFATALIRFGNGSTVSLDVAWACHAEDDNRNDVHLYGTEAGAHAMSGKVLRRDPQSGEYLVVQNLRSEVRYPHSDRFHNFINHLRGEEELCVTIEQALMVQKILDAIAESSVTGREVRLDK
jgi:predicted dehydrogenase